LRNIQILRKKAGLTPVDKIILYQKGLGEIIKKYEKALKENSGIASFVDFKSQEVFVEIEIDNELIKIGIEKVALK